MADTAASMDGVVSFAWARMEELSAPALYGILQARAAVFVVEQRCAYQDVDGLDAHAWHLRVLQGRDLVAYARVVDAGRKFTQPSIGRVLTLPACRGHHLGRLLMQEAIRFTEARSPHTGIAISAQAYLQRFYASLGFEAQGQAYDEDGIAHLHMYKRAAQARA